MRKPNYEFKIISFKYNGFIYLTQYVNLTLIGSIIKKTIKCKSCFKFHIIIIILFKSMKDRKIWQI